MKKVNDVIKIVAEVMQYFLQNFFFMMLINCCLNEKCRKMGLNKNVNNSSTRTSQLTGVGM
jgi:hypothetical protein